uniref:PX domain-containing protein n=1 Tax=Chloropicon laureae TaxID=464258 RepID=A0A7S2Z809_9CHLO|mmetsp:Transcript_9323/g.23831  ORF Transcript_9323/g.23831 Transcript_9323/m.23831 type:complete len:436 (+) Transcript_9323:63-1370(+)
MADAPPPAYDSVVIEQTDSADPLSSGGAADVSGAMSDGANNGSEAQASSPSAPGDMSVKVYDPVKQGEGMSAYVSYRVSTSTSLPQYKQQETEVIRRFRDFVWLKSKLEEKNPGVIIPPIPEKDVIQKYSTGKDFIERRRHALCTFCNRLCVHPILKFSTELQFFLEADEQAWQNEVAAGNADKGTVKKGFLGAKKFFKGVASTTSSLITGKSADEAEDPEYLKVKSYANALETHLVEVYAHADKLTTRQRKLFAAMKVFGETLSKLGEKEQEDGKNQEAFVKVADKLCSDDTLEAALSSLELGFVEPMKEYSRHVKCVRNVMADRSAALQRLHDKKQSVESKKNTLAKLRATPGAKEEKLSDAEQRLNESTRKLEEANDRYDLIKERMRTEMSAYHAQRKVDMLETLEGFANKQALLAEEQAKQWKNLVASLTA